MFFDDQPEIVEIAKEAEWDATSYRSVDDVARHGSLRHPVGPSALMHQAGLLVPGR